MVSSDFDLLSKRSVACSCWLSWPLARARIEAVGTVSRRRFLPAGGPKLALTLPIKKTSRVMSLASGLPSQRNGSYDRCVGGTTALLRALSDVCDASLGEMSASSSDAARRPRGTLD